MARIGDVYEIDLEEGRGKGYFQYCFRFKRMGSLIRVFDDIYDECPEDVSGLVNRKERFWVYFPVEAARRRGYIKRLGKYDIPAFAKEPPYMRTTSFAISDGLVSGVLREGDERVDFKNMPVDDFWSLSRCCICNDTALMDWIASGWTPDKSKF